MLRDTSYTEPGKKFVYYSCHSAKRYGNKTVDSQRGCNAKRVSEDIIFSALALIGEEIVIKIS